MRYASSDILGFFNANCPQGGHRREVTNQKDVNKGADPIYADERLVVDCAICEPLLLAKDSWSDDPTEIPLTKAEKAEADKLEKEGLKHSAQMAQAMAELAHERLVSTK